MDARLIHKMQYNVTTKIIFYLDDYKVRKN